MERASIYRHERDAWPGRPMAGGAGGSGRALRAPRGGGGHRGPSRRGPRHDRPPDRRVARADLPRDPWRPWRGAHPAVAAALHSHPRPLTMALTATIYNFDIQLADVDRGVYETLAFKVACQ